MLLRSLRKPNHNATTGCDKLAVLRPIRVTTDSSPANGGRPFPETRAVMSFSVLVVLMTGRSHLTGCVDLSPCVVASMLDPGTGPVGG